MIFRVYCARGNHPYAPIVSAITARDAIQQESSNFSQMYGKRMNGRDGCRKSGKACDLKAEPYTFHD